MPISAKAKGQFRTQDEEEAASLQAAADARRRHEEARQRLWDPAAQLAQQRLAAAQQYGLEAQQMRTAAQQGLGAGIGQARTDIMAGAGARGLSPALGRAAGYAGGALQQRGVGQARSLQAQELAAAQAMQQQAQAELAGQTMGMAEQTVGQYAAEAQAFEALKALESQRQQQQQQQMLQDIGSVVSAGGGALGQLGGLMGGGQQKPTWTPEYQKEYQQWAETYSDIGLKTAVAQPQSAQEARLIEALQKAGASTEAALGASVGQPAPSQLSPVDAQALAIGRQLQQAGAQTEAQLAGATGTPAHLVGTPGAASWQQRHALQAPLPADIAARQQQGALTREDQAFLGLRLAQANEQWAQQQAPATRRDTEAMALGRQLQEAGKDTDALLDALAGKGRTYRYTPQAQQQLGQPPGLQYGPMAQDLAKTQLGRSAVVPTPAGLAVDTGRLSMIQAGLLGRQQEQITDIEEQLRRRR